MAKKRNQEDLENQRASRKEILRKRKLDEQTRQVRIGVFIVAGLLAIIFVVAIINEFFIVPNQAVATVFGEEITLQDWQDRVRLERAQRVMLLENQLEAFGGDVGIIQQFSGQIMVDLQNAEDLGQSVLNNMIDEMVIKQAAEARGITVTEADIDQQIDELFGYYGGGLPTPAPTATETMMPTPSVTPIPTQVITDVLPTLTPVPTLTPGPTFTPQPTATPVSQESFDEQFSELITRFNDLGVDVATYRESVRAQIYRDRLLDVLAGEDRIASEAEQASFFVLSFGTEAEANEAAALIASDGYLDVWNTIKSTPFDPESTSTASASEVLWRTKALVQSSVNAQVADAVFNIDLNTPSEIIVEPVDEETNQYFIVMVTGREIRPLSDSEYENNKQQNLINFVSAQQVDQVVLTGNDRGRVPTQPVLDPLFTQPPTATPLLPTPIPADPAGDDGN
ncbi:MAG: SurA N-terminal domain-containing protein [Anaerolineales bacterium]|nr:SurA N-terminal domain-containing protein [Anaerolineales bacterium]